MSKTSFIKKKHFETMHNISKEIHGNISIIQMFCKAYEDVGDFYQILPLIERTWNLSDKLYAQLIKTKD